MIERVAVVIDSRCPNQTAIVLERVGRRSVKVLGGQGNSIDVQEVVTASESPMWSDPVYRHDVRFDQPGECGVTYFLVESGSHQRIRRRRKDRCRLADMITHDRCFQFAADADTRNYACPNITADLESGKRVGGVRVGGRGPSKIRRHVRVGLVAIFGKEAEVFVKPEVSSSHDGGALEPAIGTSPAFAKVQFEVVKRGRVFDSMQLALGRLHQMPGSLESAEIAKWREEVIEYTGHLRLR